MKTTKIHNLTLINGDCMEFMKSCKDNYFDLACVDPPYGIGTNVLKNNKSRTKLAIAKNYKSYPNNKEDRPTTEYFIELMRVSRNQIIWGANHLCNLFNASGSGWISWDKHTGDNSFSDCELAYSSFYRRLRKFDYPWNGMIQGFHGNKRFNELRIHPSQKPVKLYEWLLENYAEPNQKILDTHGGSMSIALACHNLGLELTLLEIDKDYFDAGVERVKQHVKQFRMF